MKKLLVLCSLLAFCLGLTGCTPLLDREYSSSTVHVEYPVNEDSSILQAENYQELVNAILYFVSEHQETGVIHLANYTGVVADDLSAACREVHTEDPLGAYAIADIRAESRQIVSYYEVTLSVEYAHTAEEVAAVVPVTGSSAMKQALSSAMSAFSPRCALRVSYFTGDEASLTALARQAYFDTPLAALAIPQISVALYPDHGASRIVEFTLDWPQPTQMLEEQRSQLELRTLALLEGLEGAPHLPQLQQALNRTAVFDPQGEGTAYAALTQGRANNQGMVLALRLLCQLADLDTTTVEGTLNGAPRFWLIVSTAEGYRHLDPTVQEPVYATDQAFRAAGYGWEASRYPDCIDYAAAAQQGEGAGEQPQT